MTARPVQALVVVRFHATRGQEIVSLYPPVDHGLTEQQLSDIRMLSMQECIEASPNQMQRFAVKIRDKPNRDTPSAAQATIHSESKHEEGFSTTIHSGASTSANLIASKVTFTPLGVDTGATSYAYACFTRCRDAEGSTRGYFHQSIVLVTSIHMHVGLHTPAGCTYRSLFYAVLDRLSAIIADLPAIQEAMCAIRLGSTQPLDSADAVPASGVTPSSTSVGDALPKGGGLSPTAHSWEELHRTLEVAWVHFQQWTAEGWGVPQGGDRASSQITRDLPFFGITYQLGPTDSAAHVFDQEGASGLQIERESQACLVLARLGLLPHVWTLWELLLRGKDIVIYAPSAAVTSSAILALAELLLPPDSRCSGYDIRPYVSAYDSDINESLTVSQSALRERIARSSRATNKRPPPRARLVGISNPFLLRAFGNYDCAILLPNPDIGYAVSSIFSGKSSDITFAKKAGEASIAKSAEGRGWAFPVTSAVSALFSSTSAPPPHSELLEQYTDAKVDFSPLGVGFFCSAGYSQHIRDHPEECYDVDDNGKKSYRPVIGPNVGGTPYSTVGSVPVVLRALDTADGAHGIYSSFERVYDDWLARKAHRLPLCKDSEVRGTSSSSNSHNHSKHSHIASNNGSSKCHGMILLNTRLGTKGAAAGITPEKEIQTQLDAVLCDGTRPPGSAVAIVDLILREHISNLNGAVLAPFELLCDMYSMDDCEAGSSGGNANELLHSFYGDGGTVASADLGDTDETAADFDDDEDADAIGERELLMGAIAAFQRKHLPAAHIPVSDEHSTAERIFVPPCIRKLFFDHSSIGGGGGGAAAESGPGGSRGGGGGGGGGVCSPFLTDMANSRFIYNWLRRKH